MKFLILLFATTMFYAVQGNRWGKATDLFVARNPVSRINELRKRSEDLSTHMPIVKSQIMSAYENVIDFAQKYFPSELLQDIHRILGNDQMKDPKSFNCTPVNMAVEEMDMVQSDCMQLVENIFGEKLSAVSNLGTKQEEIAKIIDEGTLSCKNYIVGNDKTCLNKLEEAQAAILQLEKELKELMNDELFSITYPHDLLSANHCLIYDKFNYAESQVPYYHEMFEYCRMESANQESTEGEAQEKPHPMEEQMESIAEELEYDRQGDFME